MLLPLGHSLARRALRLPLAGGTLGDFRLLQHHKVTGELYEVTAESTATAVADDVAPTGRTTAEYLISHAAGRASRFLAGIRECSVMQTGGVETGRSTVEAHKVDLIYRPVLWPTEPPPGVSRVCAEGLRVCA